MGGPVRYGVAEVDVATSSAVQQASELREQEQESNYKQGDTEADASNWEASLHHLWKAVIGSSVPVHTNKFELSFRGTFPEQLACAIAGSIVSFPDCTMR